MADDISKRLARFVEPFRVSPGSSVKLARDFDPGFKAGVEKKKDGVDLLKGGIELLAEYQARLAAQDTFGVLVVLQALDAAGKDGTIRHVLSGVNPQGVRVESFKVPSARELDQDFLRRYQQRLPSRGEIGIFNRSHYEEVLVVRVAAAAVIANALIEIDPQYPRLSDVALRDLETAKRRLEAEAPNGAAADPFEPRESGGNGSNGDTAVPVTPSGTPAQQEG